MASNITNQVPLLIKFVKLPIRNETFSTKAIMYWHLKLSFTVCALKHLYTMFPLFWVVVLRMKIEMFNRRQIFFTKGNIITKLEVVVINTFKVC